jgi:MFS family permease
MMAEASEPRQSTRFLLLYALAAAGGAIAYVPFLTILLPVRMTALAGQGDIQALGYVTFFGAIAASTGGVLFGWLSDRTKNRRSWIVAGLILTIALLLAVPLAEDVPTLIAIIIGWQLALNMMLGPLSAWGGDLVPDHQKGLLGGLLAFSPALGALSGAIVTVPGLAGADARLALVGLLVAGAVLPVLLLGRPRPFPELSIPSSDEAPSRPSAIVARMWFARLLVQIAEAALFAYLFFWFRSIEPAITDSETAQLFSLVLTVAVPLALLTGRWADRNDRPILPLAICATILSLGLAAMALSETLLAAKLSYVVFGIAATIFLSLHSGQTLRILPRPEHRARDLGLFNLTNTVPSLIMPWLTISLVPGFGFDALFLLLAGLASVAVLLLATMPRLR